MIKTKDCINLIALSILSIVMIAPACGLDLGVLTNKVSVQTTLGLDDSTATDGRYLLNGETIFHSRETAGSGNNEIRDVIAGPGYTAESSTANSGSITSALSASASPELTVLNQRTNMGGDAGYANTNAASGRNEMYVSGIFSGSGGSLGSDLVAVASQNGALIGGRAEINGFEGFSDSTSNVIGSNDMGRSIEGVYRGSNGGVGHFGFDTANAAKTGSQTTTSPYKLTGYKWTEANPKIELMLRTDTIPTDLTAQQVNAAISAGASVWDNEVSRTLFAPLTETTNANLGISTAAPDYNNVLLWASIPDSNTIAVTGTWYSRLKIGGYSRALDSDMVYNTYFSWDISEASTAMDIQTIACHEVGHTLGLADLYTTNPTYQAQMMYGYCDEGIVKKALGSGDIAGIHKLYGT